MTQRIRIRDLGDPLEATTVEPRELAINASKAQLYAGYGTTPQELLSVRVWSPGVAYVANDLVGYAGDIYRCRLPIAGNAPTDPTYWMPITGESSGTGTDWVMATQAEALDGTSNTVVMSPLRTKQSVDQAITVNNQALPAILGPYIEFIANQSVEHETLPGESIDVAIDSAIAAAVDMATVAEAIEGTSTTTIISPFTMKAAVQAQLFFFDKAGDLAAVTVPAGTDVIYRLGWAKRGDHEITRFKRKVDAPTTAPTNNLAWEKDAAGVYFVNDMPRLDCRTLGAFATGKELKGSGAINTMTAGSNVVTVPGANFTAADLGSWMQVNGAGPLIENSTTVPPGTSHDLIWTDYLTGKIGSVDSATQVKLVDAAGAVLNATQTVTGAEAKTVWWTADGTDMLKNGLRAAATMGRFLYLPGNPFYHFGNKSLCGINGYSNARIEGDGPSTRLVHGNAQVPGDGSMFYFVGALTPRTNLTAPAAAGTDIITVGSTATGFAVDSYLALRDKTQPNYILDNEEPFGVFTGYRGEYIRVRAIIDATHVQLHSQLEENYAASAVVGQESDVRSLGMINDITIRNIALDLTKPITCANVAIISVARSLRLTVDNVYFMHSTGAMGLGHCIDWTVRNCRFDWSGIVDGAQGDGDHDKVKSYGIVLTGIGAGGHVQNCIFRNVRHAITASGGSDMAPKHVHMSGCSSFEGRPCIDTHPGADYWTINDCHAVGGIWVDEVAQSGGGFQIRGSFNDITNCSARGVISGIQPCFVEGTRIINFRADMCDVGVSLYNCRNTELINTTLTRIKTMGLYFHVSISVTKPLQSIGYCKIKGFRLVGNPYAKTAVEDYVCDLPCGMQFGYWNGMSTVTPPFTATFFPQWYPGITIEDWEMPDCVVPFNGADHEAVYGPGILDVATAQNMRREEVASAGIAALTSGTLFLSEIPLKVGRRFSQVGLPFATAGAGQTNLWFGLFDRNRNLVAKSPDLLTVAPSTTAVTFGTLNRTHVTREEGRHYIGVCWTGTTPPQVYGRSVAAPFAAQAPALGGNSNTGLTGPASYPQISSATSTSLLTATLQYPFKQIITQSGKAFTQGMRVRVALTASPATDYFEGTVTNYSSTTLWVNCDVMVGLVALAPATLNAWTITADAVATAITATGNLAFVVTA